MLRGLAPAFVKCTSIGTNMKCKELPPAVLGRQGPQGSAPGGSEWAVNPWQSCKTRDVLLTLA